MDDTAAMPTPGGLARYLRQDLRHDAVAGLTVALMGVPQAMAYAILAGLPAVYGIYTAIITGAVAALLGSSRHLITGPSNGLCMVMFSLTSGIDTAPEKLEVILLLTFLSGAIQLAFGLLRLGGIVRYVANSVVIGFTAGAGVLIALNQLKHLLGVRFLDSAKPRASYEVLYETVRVFDNTNTKALIIGVGTGLLVALLPKLHRRLPAALLSVIVGAVACYLLGWHLPGADKVKIVGDIEGGIRGSLAIFHLPEHIVQPDYQLTREYATGALAMALFGLIEATSIARTIARASEQRLDFNREFVGQGASKLVGSFFSSFAGSGSFIRTAINYRSGTRTRMGALFAAGWTALMLVAFGEVANFIPLSGLAGMLIVNAYTMIPRDRLRLSWHSGTNSRIVLVGTIVSTLLLPLEWAIFVGVFLSLAVILRTTGKTHLTQLVQRDDGGFEEVPFNRAAPSPVVTINMDGDIYFAAAEDLDSELLRCLTPQTKVVVLRMKRLRAIGSTAMSMLAHFSKLLRRRNVHLIVCGVEKELEDVMTKTGVRALIGETNIFFADNRLFQSTTLALARARSVAGESGARSSGTDDRRLTARDVMSPRCIRFGNKHQLREAVWLMSELHKHTKAISYQPLFLQDREGKIFGELSPWGVLRALLAGTEGADRNLDDDRLAALLRRDFTRPIRGIANTDISWEPEDAPLARVLKDAVASDEHVVPICDEEGRIKGLLSSADLLRGLGKMMLSDDEVRHE